MSLQTRISDLITAVGTDYKQIRTWISGSSGGDLTGLTTTAKTSLVDAINEVKSAATGAPPLASEGSAGVAEVATTTETTTGTDDSRMITPLKLKQRLISFAQPLSANLSTLSDVVSTVFGRTLLTSADAPAARTALGLAPVASSGLASDLTGVLNTAQLPPLAINETFTAANQAAMLALAAQRGDVAIRTDQNNHMYMLTTDNPATLADWVQIVGAGDVTSVAGRTGGVVLARGDVGLGNVDNTSDATKPVSAAQANAIALKLSIANNLSDLANAATARNNLSVYSQAELGNPETDLVGLYTAAKA